jgi:hypothetical protein
MQPTGAQADEKGDVVALSFGSPDEEADHIARTARSLHGVAIREDGGQMRGITWADMAVLLRTVKGNGAPIMRALDRAKVPEAIHFQSKPSDKYESFAGFLQHGAEDAYPEAWLDNEYANPDAVRVMTIHQAKGMQWPSCSSRRSREPVPVEGTRRTQRVAPAPGRRGPERRPVPGRPRGRAAPLLRRHDAQPEVPAPDMGSRQPALPEGIPVLAGRARIEVGEAACSGLLGATAADPQP